MLHQLAFGLKRNMRCGANCWILLLNQTGFCSCWSSSYFCASGLVQPLIYYHSSFLSLMLKFSCLRLNLITNIIIIPIFITRTKFILIYISFSFCHSVCYCFYCCGLSVFVFSIINYFYIICWSYRTHTKNIKSPFSIVGASYNISTRSSN